MALPALAAVSDMEARLGQPITDDAERARAEALLSDASTLVRYEARATWVDAEGNLTAIPDLAAMITLTAALRAWYNPAGIDAAQLGAVSIRYQNVWLSQVERDQLAGLTSGGIVSLTLEHGLGFNTDTDVGWVPYDFTGLGAAPGDMFPIGYLGGQ